MGVKNRLQGMHTLEQDVCALFLKFTTDANGVATIVKGKGIATCARTGAGAYTITLDQKWAGGLLSLVGTVTDGEDVICQVAEDNSAAAAKTILVVFTALETPANTELTSATVWVQIVLARR